MGWIWIFAFLVGIGTLAYQKASLHIWTLFFAIFLVCLSVISHLSHTTVNILWVLFAISALFLYWDAFRQKVFTKKVLSFYRKNMPTMSTTEREALAAGTVGWEGDLFCGDPDWNKLFNFRKPELSDEEEAFINDPVEKLCAMLDDWNIVHNLYDLPPDIWQFLKDEGFFALIIPKKYGGKEFSAYAHSQILTKVYGRSTTAGTTIAVPNSLGPAELLLHYGTEEQKNYYLPRLAKGLEMPCFALTGLEAGSDAGSMTDTGIVTYGEFDGKKVLGLRLNWNKRYITLAPVATVVGLAFKMYDPDHLLGTRENLGISCALIPSTTEGVTIGRRHLPSGIVFQNGPTEGKDVFIPLDYIIGGPEMAGHGWRMLMECLAAGRAISLPAGATGGAKALAYTTGAYARIRRQFKVPIGRFEGVAEGLARIAGYTYLMDATRSFTAGMIDIGEKPAVASAITKLHVTELGRYVANDGMDIHAGKGIMMGPHNYLAIGYQVVPIAITVEGANILTRNMIIFGQGAMRCHPYVFKEFEAASITNESERLQKFDNVLMGHFSYTISNFFRTFILGLTGGYIVKAAKDQKKRYLQQATRFSAAFAFLSDVSLLVFGGALKRKENISARLGDILSYLYLLSASLKHFTDEGEPTEDLPIVRYSALYCFYQIQKAFDEILKNLPNRFLAGFLRFIIFPFGKHFSLPSDRLGLKVAELILGPTASRERLAKIVFTTDIPNNMFAVVQDALLKVIAAEPIEKILKNAVSNGTIIGDTIIEQAEDARLQKIISDEQFHIIQQAETARKKVIMVDDFAAEDLPRKEFLDFNRHDQITQYKTG